MKYLTIKVGRSLNQVTGEEWVKLDSEVSVDENESPYEVFKKVMNDSNQWLPNPHKTSYNVNEEMLPLYPLKTTKSSKEEQIEGFKQAISMTTSKSSLEKLFKKISDNTPELKDAYDEKMKEFS